MQCVINSEFRGRLESHGMSHLFYSEILVNLLKFYTQFYTKYHHIDDELCLPLA